MSLMAIVWFLVFLLLLAGALWILGKILDMFLEQSGFPPQLKPIIIGLVALAGVIFLIYGVRGGGFRW
jgi:hypothetical protein